jgi:hypothetical protein
MIWYVDIVGERGPSLGTVIAFTKTHAERLATKQYGDGVSVTNVRDIRTYSLRWIPLEDPA